MPTQAVSEPVILLIATAKHIEKGRWFARNKIGDADITDAVIDLDRDILRQVREDLHAIGDYRFDKFIVYLLQ
jgi:hypothetical protein